MKLTQVVGVSLVLATSACSDEVSKDDARVGYAIAQGFAATAATQVRTQAMTAAPPADFNFTQACATGGDISMTGAFSGTTADFSFSFNSCSQGGIVFDGGWAIGGTADRVTVAGGISITGSQLDISCDFDLAVDANGLVSGTACGYDVSELNGR